MTEDEEMLALMAVLEEETEVATRTRMNKDYVPGMVTVLHGDQLEALGAITVAEAMAFVPGVQISRKGTGEPMLNVRGLAYPFNSGNVKIMLNSVSISRESSGVDSAILLLPITQVERIEVVRGPGSILHGDFALTGVVNIITRQTGGRLSGLLTEYGRQSGSGHFGYRTEDGTMGASVNFSLTEGGLNGANLDFDPDDERTVGIFRLDYNNFKLTAQSERRDVSATRAPPPLPGSPPLPPTRSDVMEGTWVVDGRQTVDLSDDAKLEGHVTYLETSYDSPPKGAYYGSRVDTGLELQWSPLDGHELVMGGSYTFSTIDEAYDAPTTLTAAPSNYEDEERTSFSLLLQDQISLGKQFTLTVGGRYDDYDDIGGVYTPRVAGVYRINDNHVLKAQYAEGFRPPTFWELYQANEAGNDLDFETIRTAELSYIYHRPQMVGRVTLFHSSIGDGIYFQGSGHGNVFDFDAHGVELEWEQQILETLRWQANLSYVHATDNRNEAAEDATMAIADWLANLALIWQPAPGYTLAGLVRHVGERGTSDGSDNGFTTMDLTFSRKDFIKKGLLFRLGVKNLFDQDVEYLNLLPTGVQAQEFDRRTLWAQISYEF